MLNSENSLKPYESYVLTQNQWMPRIPAHWKKSRFKFNANTLKGKLPKKLVSNKDDNTHIYMTMEYLRGGEANQWVLDKNALIVESDEILLLWDGSNSGEFLKSRKGVVSSTVAHISFFQISKQFAWYFTKLTERQLRSSTVGMGIPHVNGEELRNSELLIPPLSEQTAIANFLDQKTANIDQAITTKEKQITLLKERKQILVQNAVTRGLDPDAPMRDSGVDWIGEIPEHWEVYANRALFKERVEPGEEGLPLLSVSIHSGVSSEELAEEDNVRGRVKIEDKSKYNLVEPNDIVFNMMRAWQGAIGCVKVKGMVSPAYIIAQPLSRINSTYYEYQYRCPEFIQQMDRYSKGITDFRKRLYWDEFKQLVTVVPPEHEQENIVKYIEHESLKIVKAINLQERQIEKLKEYKATLINSAVTGKIRVPGVEDISAQSKEAVCTP